MKEMKYTHARALINKISTWTTELKAGQQKTDKREGEGSTDQQQAAM